MMTALTNEEINNVIGGKQKQEVSIVDTVTAFLNGFIPVVLIGGGLYLFSRALQKTVEKGKIK